MILKLNHLKFYSILIVCSLCLILLSGEFIARIFVQKNDIPPLPEQSTIDPYSINPYTLGMRPYVHFHIPNAKYTQSRSYYTIDYNINSKGFRGPEIYAKQKDKDKNEDKNRLIVIGDSIVEGHGCEFNKTFSYLLNKKADKYNWSVLNLGMQGTSPLCYAANIKRYLSANPDIALIVLFDNDLADDRFHEKIFFKRPVMDNPDSLLINTKSGHSILNKSRLYLLFKRAYINFFPTSFEKIIKTNRKNYVCSDKQKELSKSAPWLIEPSELDKQWSMSEKYLNFMVLEFKKNKIPVYIVYLSLSSLHPLVSDAYLQHAKNLDIKIEKWANSNNIPFLSLIPTIQNLFLKLHPAEIMIKNDGHPTPMTHAVIAEQIWKWLSPVTNHNP